MAKENKTHSSAQANYIIKGTREGTQFVIYDDFSGNPLKVTNLSGHWWLTTPGLKLQRLEDYLGSPDAGMHFLTEAGGKVGALALTRMLGKALSAPEDEVGLVLRNRVADLRRLGVTLDVKDEALALKLKIFANEGKTCRKGKYSMWCHLDGNFCELLFDIDGFDTKKVAEEWARLLFDYMEELGIDFTIV